MTKVNLPSFPVASQKSLGSSITRGFPVKLAQLPNGNLWEAKIEALQAPYYGASQLPSFPLPKGRAAFGKRRPLEASRFQPEQKIDTEKGSLKNADHEYLRW